MTSRRHLSPMGLIILSPLAMLLFPIGSAVLFPKAPYKESVYRPQHPHCAQGGTIKSYKGVEVCYR
jgi:hypothetical protein